MIGLAAAAEWNNIPRKEIQNLIIGMPRTLAALISAKRIKYQIPDFIKKYIYIIK